MVRRLAVELHVPVRGLAIRKANPGHPLRTLRMSAGSEGHQDSNVLLRLRQLGLHPAVRVLEYDGTRSLIRRSIFDLLGDDGDHEPLLRLITSSQTA